jgi:hypothetical protein
MGNPIMVVVVGDTGWQFDRDAVRANVEPMGLRLSGREGVAEVTVRPTSVAVRADRATTATVIAWLRALAPAEVALVCFDEAYTRPQLELVSGIDADGVGRLLYGD